MNVGMHYKVKWHHKATDEVAGSNLSTYIEIPDDTKTSKCVSLIKEAVTNEVEILYPAEKFNVKIYLKNLVMPESINGVSGDVICIGDQKMIDDDIERWGY